MNVNPGLVPQRYCSQRLFIVGLRPILQDAIGALRESPDPFHLAEQEARFANVRAAISPDATLGYITDHPEGILGEARSFAAQYYLAPRIVQNSLAQNLILSDFVGPIDLSAFAGAHALRVERTFGNGVVLFRKEEARH